MSSFTSVISGTSYFLRSVLISLYGFFISVISLLVNNDFLNVIADFYKIDATAELVINNGAIAFGCLLNDFLSCPHGYVL